MYQGIEDIEDDGSNHGIGGDKITGDSAESASGIIAVHTGVPPSSAPLSILSQTTTTTPTHPIGPSTSDSAGTAAVDASAHDPDSHPEPKKKQKRSRT